MKNYKSFINERVMELFYPDYKENGFDLFQYANWKCGIDGLISAAYLFSPEIIQIKDYIFLKDFLGKEEDYNYAVSQLERQYNYDKKMIEMHVNTCSIGDFFVGCNDQLMDDNTVLNMFGESLVFYWGKRVKELFPEKNVVVKLSENLMGEYGLCITMFEDVKM